MPDNATYEFAVIRVVPRVEREEFLNVGVILFCKRKKFLGIKYHLDARRIRAFAGEIDIDALRDYLEAWEQVSAGAPAGGPIGELDQASRFRWLTATRSTIIQSSRPHPGVCHNPEQVLEDLFRLYVL